MPSTTSNYGWTYPISSDDLNAGATSVGSLATGIDSTLKAQIDAEAATRAAADSSEAATRAAADSSEAATRAAADAVRPTTSTLSTINQFRATYTTNSSGVITVAFDTDMANITVTDGGFWTVIHLIAVASNQYQAWGVKITGGYDVIKNQAIRLNGVFWS